jgi:DNA-binding beta-propeller fold protein YncE
MKGRWAIMFWTTRVILRSPRLRLSPRAHLAIALGLLLLATSLGWSQDHDYFVLGIHPAGLLVIDTSRDEIVAQIPTKGRSPKEIIPSPDGKHVFLTTDGRAKIEVVNVPDRKVEEVIDLAQPGVKINIFGLAVSRKGDRLFAHIRPVKQLPDEYVALPPEIWSVDLNTHAKKKIMDAPDGVVSLFVPADPNRLIAWGRNVYFIDLAQRHVVETVPLQTGLLPDQSPMDTLPFFSQYEQSGIVSMPSFATNPFTHNLVLGLVNMDVDTGKLDFMELGPPIPLYSSVVSPDRKRAYLVMNQLVVVDLTQRKIAEVRDTEGTTYVVNLTRDGKKVYLPSSAGPFVNVYDAQSLKRIHSIELPGDPSSSQLRALPPGAVP